MNLAVNFLPWRRIRFYRQLRRWGAGVAACWLCGAAVVLFCWLNGQAARTVNAMHIAAERQIAQQLALRERAQAERAKQQALNAQKHARRQATLAWSARLTTLAEGIPAQAWLNELDYRDRTLSLSATLTRFPALTELEHRLETVPGFQPAKPGKIQRDSTGRWLVRYQLNEEIAHATP